MDSATASEELSTSAQQGCRFSLTEIQSATNNFDEKLVIGHGGFGKVYKGSLCTDKFKSSHEVAIKRLDSFSDQGSKEFKTEIELLSNLRHRHLVSLIGFCDDKPEMILVYEYMTHGSLYDHLHKVGTPLDWVQRIRIAIGGARGLDYLHTGTQQGVVHRDVKSSNILLDENWTAKISDFGLSRIGPINQSISYVDASVKGTFGYLDPAYFFTNKLSRKTDVYAFGVVLFELLSGRCAVDKHNVNEEYSLVRWAQKCVKERKLDQMVDSKIQGMILPKCLRQFAQIGDHCVRSDLKYRPTMTEVVAKLQALLELQEQSNHSKVSPGLMGFTWNLYKYILSTTRPNSDQSQTSPPKRVVNSMINQNEELETSSTKSIVNSMNQHEALETGDIKIFTYDQLKVATKNFHDSRYLNDFNFFTMSYKGWLNKETYSPCNSNAKLRIAVEILRCSSPFDLELLKQFRNPNIVKVIGYCLEGSQQFLVNEIFLRKGNFEDLLHRGVIARLPLVTKVKIIVGIARGLDFLQMPQFNKSWPAASMSKLYRHKILLDEDFTPKLSGYDFTFIVDRRRDIAYQSFQDIDGLELVLKSDQSGYEVIFTEVLTGERIYNSNKLFKIDRMFLQCEIKSLRDISRLCFEMCNEEDSESTMITMLKEHDELIQRRLKSWLSDPNN